MHLPEFHMKSPFGFAAHPAFIAVLLALGACAREPATPITAPEVKPAIAPGPYAPGQSYYGRNNYIEYIAGDAPVILSAPHGGHLTPGEIPDRTSGSCGGSATTVKDLNTRELALAMQRRYHARHGKYPHVIINHLHRIKLDANRDLVGGACGAPEAQIAWNEFQDYIDVAKKAVLSATGRGWYMDMHGHGHDVQRLELGYLLSDAQLDLSDATLDASKVFADTASLKAMSEFNTQLSLSAVLRGSSSLGTLYANNGFPSVPSSAAPSARDGEAYFSGGYNTRRHGCGVEASPLGGTSGGNICGVQIEANYTGVRDTQANMDRFGDVTAVVLDTYLSTHWGLDLDAGGPGPANTPPTARFTASCSGLTCSFTDASSDADGSIVSWSWRFGDNTTSNAQHPTHTYSAGGTYTVQLTVTDNGGATASASRTVTASSPISLSVKARKSKGYAYADLSWSGAAGTSVDVYRNGVKRATTPNDGVHTDSLGKVSGTLTYKICEAGSTTCSGEAQVTF